MSRRGLPIELHELFEKHCGLLTQKQALAAGLAPHVLAYWARKGVLTRVQRGVYRLEEAEGFAHEQLLEVALRAPQAVVCLMSAATFHELGTFVPHELHFALPRGAREPELSYPPVVFHHFSEAQYDYGLEQHPVGGGEIKVYSKEKTLADLLRFRDQYGLSLFLQTLKDYLGQRGFNTTKLFEAARVCRVEPLMRQYVATVLA